MKSYRAVRRKRRCSHRKLLLVVLLTLTAGGAVAFAGFIKLTLEPNMEELAKIRAEVLVSRTVTRVLTEQFQKDTYKDELFTVTKDDEGNMSMVQADSAKINLLMSQISARLQESFQNMKKEEFSVPAGALLGSRFLSRRPAAGRDHGQRAYLRWILKRSLKRRESIRPNIKFTLCSRAGSKWQPRFLRGSLRPTALF